MSLINNYSTVFILQHDSVITSLVNARIHYSNAIKIRFHSPKCKAICNLKPENNGAKSNGRNMKKKSPKKQTQ